MEPDNVARKVNQSGAYIGAYTHLCRRAVPDAWNFHAMHGGYASRLC
jgi:hypothetical protein